MSNILSSIWNLIKKIIGKIFSWLADIFGDLFLILLIIVIIYFAPYILGYLASIGAPAFLVDVFVYLSVATPYIQSAVAWLWAGGGSLLSSAWSAYSGLSTGTQAAIAVGAAALIAPEETAAVLEDAMDLVETGVAALATGVLSSPLGLLAVGVGLWFLLGRKDKKQEDDRANSANLTGQEPSYG